MTRRLVISLVLLSGLVLAKGSAQPAQNKIAPEKLAEGLWATPTPGGANVGWFTLGDDVIAVDAGATPDVGRALVDEIQKTTGKKPRYLVVTHAHRDHAGGVAAFAAAGAQIIGSEKAAPGILAVLDAAAREASTTAKAPARSAPVRSAPAAMVMTVAERSLFVGSPLRRAEIYYLGPGHTQGDLIVVLPTDGVLFSGDLAGTGVLPFLRSADVDPRGWERILQRLAALKIEKMVPGHGVIGPREGIADTAAYIARVNEIAARLVQSNPPDGLVEAQLSTPENTIENVRLTPDHIANVKAVYHLARAERAKPAASPTPTPRAE
jgi:glyoxylase-like metal-dependent hydrolase (beta-lactamase superfamily II)